MLGRPFRIGVFSSRREEVEGGKGTEETPEELLQSIKENEKAEEKKESR